MMLDLDITLHAKNTYVPNGGGGFCLNRDALKLLIEVKYIGNKFTDDLMDDRVIQDYDIFSGYLFLGLRA